MQKAYNQNLSIGANQTKIFLKNGCLEKQMKAANPSLKTETYFISCYLSTSRFTRGDSKSF